MCRCWALLAQGDTLREALAVTPMDMDVGDELTPGLDWISSRDLRLLYVDDRISLRSGPAQLKMYLFGPPGPNSVANSVANAQRRCRLSATGSAGSSARSRG